MLRRAFRKLTTSRVQTAQITEYELPRPSLKQKLEPRLMFDGAAVASALDAVDLSDGANEAEQQAVMEALNNNEHAQAMQSVFETLGDDSEHVLDPNLQFSEVVIIDANVKDPQILIEGINRDAAVEFIDSNKDGVQAIADILAKYQNLDAIHIVSHGDQAQLQLGSVTLNQANLDSYQAVLNQWGNALSTNGDVLFYGCNVAEGDSGQAFIEQLAEFTCADIAASQDITGGSDQGGDWLLEAAVDSETQDGANDGILAVENYGHVLVPQSQTSDYNDLEDGTTIANHDGLTYTADSATLEKDGHWLAASGEDAGTITTNKHGTFYITGISSLASFTYHNAGDNVTNYIALSLDDDGDYVFNFDKMDSLIGGGHGTINLADWNNGADVYGIAFSIASGNQLYLDNLTFVPSEPANTAPTVSPDPTVTLNEDSTYSFSVDDFNFSDVDEGDALASITITGGDPGGGRLQFNGEDIDFNSPNGLSLEIIKAQLDNGLLVFRPNDNHSGDAYASFTYTVNDGEADSESSYTMTINVNAVPELSIANNTPSYTENGNLLQIAGGVEDVFTHDSWNNGVSLEVRINPDAQENAIDANDGLTLTSDNFSIVSVDGTINLTSGEGDAYVDIATLTPVDGTISDNGNAFTVTGSNPMTITFTDNATDEHAQTILQSIYYHNTSDNPSTADRTVTFTATDTSTQGAITATRAIKVTAVNDAPSITSISNIEMNEDAAAQTVTVTATDAESDNVTFSVEIGDETLATVDIEAQGTLSITPKSNAHGSATITVTATDAQGAQSQQQFTLTINSVNDAPVAVADTGNTDENTATTVAVITNDTDVDTNDTLSLKTGSAVIATMTYVDGNEDTQSITQSDASVSQSGNEITFNPGSDFDFLAVGESATVVINYTVEDESGGSSDSTLTLTVTGTNDGPVAVTDTGETPENTAKTVNVITNDTDVDASDTLSLKGGSVTIATMTYVDGNEDTQSITQSDASVCQSGNEITFNPGSDFDFLAVGESATVIINYTVEDESGGSSDSTLTLTVTGTNDVPTITVGDTDSNHEKVTETNAGIEVSGTLTLADVDTTDRLFWSVREVLAASDGSKDGTATVLERYGLTKEALLSMFEVSSNDAIGSTLTWVFNSGSETFDKLPKDTNLTLTYKIQIKDSQGQTVEQGVMVTLQGTNDVPLTTAITTKMSEDSTYRFKASDFSFTDVDLNGQFKEIKIVSLPNKGVLQFNGKAVEAGDVIAYAEIGKLTYQPEGNGFGEPYTSFKFAVSDGMVKSDDQTVTVNVTDVPELLPPVTTSVAPPTNVQAMSTEFATQTLPSESGDTTTADSGMPEVADPSGTEVAEPNETEPTANQNREDNNSAEANGTVSAGSNGVGSGMNNNTSNEGTEAPNGNNNPDRGSDSDVSDSDFSRYKDAVKEASSPEKVADVVKDLSQKGELNLDVIEKIANDTELTLDQMISIVSTLKESETANSEEAANVKQAAEKLAKEFSKRAAKDTSQAEVEKAMEKLIHEIKNSNGSEAFNATGASLKATLTKVLASQGGNEPLPGELTHPVFAKQGGMVNEVLTAETNKKIAEGAEKVKATQQWVKDVFSD